MFIDIESALGEPSGIIPPINPHMILLAEIFLALAGIGYRRILESSIPMRLKRNLKYGKTARTEYAKEFIHYPAVIGYVLKHMIAENHIKRGIFKWNLMEVEMKIGQGRLKISCNVFYMIEFL